jgi:hypothetical protein
MHGRQCDFLLPTRGYRRLLWVHDLVRELPFRGLADGDHSDLREEQSDLGRGHPAVAGQLEAGLPIRP